MTTGEACRRCGHEFGMHGPVGCDGRVMSGGQHGIVQWCGCWRFLTTEEHEARQARR